MHGADALQELPVLRRAAALRPVPPLVVAAARHAENGTHPGHPEEPSMTTNEGVLHGSSRAKYATAFLRNSSVAWSSLQNEAQRPGAPLQIGEDTAAILFFIVVGTRIPVGHAVPEG